MAMSSPATKRQRRPQHRQLTATVPPINAAVVDSPTLTAHITHNKFEDYVRQGLLSPLIAFPFETFTDVQAQAIPIILRGGDVLAQARTGTGKSLAFILPTIQNLITSRPRPGQISALIMSPTRELAAQIATAGEPLLINSPHLAIQTATGGVNPRSELQRLKTQQCDILVATPGRILDHLQNGGLQAHMQELRVLVLDEADRLLDQGFKQDLQKIVAFLPDRKTAPRQNLLFSATMPAGVREV